MVLSMVLASVKGVDLVLASVKELSCPPALLLHLPLPQCLVSLPSMLQWEGIHCKMTVGSTKGGRSGQMMGHAVPYSNALWYIAKHGNYLLWLQRLMYIS